MNEILSLLRNYNKFRSEKEFIKIRYDLYSNLQTIGEYEFSKSKIKEIFIPSKVSITYKDAFTFCNNLQIIEISEESKLESSSLSAFDDDSECIIMIPTSLEKLILKNESI